MIGKMTRMAFESWLVTDEAWRRHGELLVLNNEDYDNRDTLKTRLQVAKKIAEAIGGAQGARAVVFRGDGADDISLPQFDMWVSPGRVNRRFGELAFELLKINELPDSEEKSSFEGFVRYLQHYASENDARDFQSVMLYLRSQSCVRREPTKTMRLYAVRYVGDRRDPQRSELLPWAFSTASRAKGALWKLAESAVPCNWERYRIIVDRGGCVVDKLPRRQGNEYPYYRNEDEHFTLSVESVDVPTEFTAVPNAEGDWYVGNWDLMRTKAWDTKGLSGPEWLERINPHYYRDNENLEDHSLWSLFAENAAAKCDWWKIDVATLDIWQWLYVLRFRPDLVNACPYLDEFDPFQWSFLLRRQPRFAERCNRFNEFRPELWSFLLSRQPQFADRCTCWNDMCPDAWERLLKAQPQFLDRIDLEHADGDLWAKVVKCFPEYGEKCPWEKLSNGAWTDLLSDCILDARPQLASYFKKWDELDEAQQFKLLQKSPRICECVDFTAFPLVTRINYLLLRPEFAKDMDWRDVVDPADWYRLLARVPECENFAPKDVAKPEAKGRVWIGKSGPVVVIPRPSYQWINEPPPFAGHHRIRAGQYSVTPWGVAYEGNRGYSERISYSSASAIVEHILEGATNENCQAIDIEGVYVERRSRAGATKFAEILKDWFTSHESSIKIVHLECGNRYGRIE